MYLLNYLPFQNEENLKVSRYYNDLLVAPYSGHNTISYIVWSQPWQISEGDKYIWIFYLYVFTTSSREKENFSYLGKTFSNMPVFWMKNGHTTVLLILYPSAWKKDDSKVFEDNWCKKLVNLQPTPCEELPRIQRPRILMRNRRPTARLLSVQPDSRCLQCGHSYPPSSKVRTLLLSLKRKNERDEIITFDSQNYDY